MSTLILSKESVYAAVPISSELYIIPKSSRGFHWNGDLFLKPHQRRSLGVDLMFSASSQQYHAFQENGHSDGGDSHLNEAQPNQQHPSHSHDSSVTVHEIHLDDQETAGILPSWP
ncbi:hypothetical protein BGZ98_006406 [Dissophora globulifera]|nr:hypothetical protein BGZ98_006406 [Dissophora globulifera]